MNLKPGIGEPEFPDQRNDHPAGSYNEYDTAEQGSQYQQYELR